MPDPEVTNWFGDLVSHPKVIVEANSKEDIVAVLKNPAKYPSPVRAVGSNHSTALCGAADGGTLIQMKMNRILNIGPDTVTVEAGAVHLDIARELEKKQLQFYVNTEIGSLSAGSAACAGTKDSSMPGEFGQVGSYVIGVKMVLPSGDLLEVTEDQPELMKKIRSSYGTFGIVYEVTFRIRKLVPMAVHHKTYRIKEFLDALPELKALNYSIMYYVFPFTDYITVEFRKYNPGAKGDPDHHIWELRNHIWAVTGPKFARDLNQKISNPTVRFKAIDDFGALWRFKLENLVHSDNSVATDQIIHYPAKSDDSRYTFSLFAFPEERFPSVLTDYIQFNIDHYKKQGYRSDLLSVGYRISQDQNSLLSYSYDGPVMTVDPVSTGSTGWKPYLEAYNQFCSDRGGLPLFNQTYGLTRAMAQKAFGSRLQELENTRKTYDPEGRLLNDYFRTLLAPEALSSTV